MTDTKKLPGDHRIVVVRDDDGDVASIQFICEGTPDHLCHWYPNCQCESWTEESHPRVGPPAAGHESVGQEDCWMQPWFENSWMTDWEVAEAGGLTDVAHLISGPIVGLWESDHLDWRYDDSRMEH